MKLYKLRKHVSSVAGVGKPKKGHPPSLIAILEHRAAEDMQPWQGWFRPSMLFGCDRENVFHYQGVRKSPRRIDPKLRRVLDNGTAIHELIQNEYLPYHPDYWFVKEPKVQRRFGGFLVKGSCDGVVIRRKDMFRFGIEIKTIVHSEFMRLAKPKPEHVFQASLYMHLQKLPWIVILYWDKDKHLLKEFPVKADESVAEEAAERVEYLGQFVDHPDGKLPRYNKAMCNKTFCHFVDHCRKKGAPV